MSAEAGEGFLKGLSMGSDSSIASGIFGYLSDRVSTPGSRTFLYPVYILALGAAVAIILIIVDAYYPFLPINPISGPSTVARNGKTFWSGLTYDAQNLVVPAKSSPTQTAADYTVSVQLLLQDSRTPLNGRFRHILHRGANPCLLSVSQPGPTGHNNIQISDIPNVDSSYASTGLPTFMNPGLMLDPTNNDLHVFVHTHGQEYNKQVLWLESATVEDLPLNTPLTIGVVLSGQTLEVYMNCRLYTTKLLKGTPFLANTELSAWFGRACAFPATGAIQNLTLWSAALNSGDYLQMCRAADFSKMTLPQICPTGTCGSG